MNIPIYEHTATLKTEKNPIKGEVAKSMDRIFKKLPVPAFIGSNSWVIGPEKTKNGKVLFANDPHIGYAQPSVWYEAHVHTPTYEMYGYHLAGVPFPLLGHNKQIAYGMTMFENDDMDLYAEKLNPNNANQYWAIDHWQDFETRTEQILVKDAKTVEFKLRSSRHGTIINNIFDEVPGSKYGLDKIKQPLALWWTFLDPSNDMMQAFYELPNATTVEKASAAAALFVISSVSNSVTRYIPTNAAYGPSDSRLSCSVSAMIATSPELLSACESVSADAIINHSSKGKRRRSSEPPTTPSASMPVSKNASPLISGTISNDARAITTSSVPLIK